MGVDARTAAERDAEMTRDRLAEKASFLQAKIEDIIRRRAAERGHRRLTVDYTAPREDSP